MNTFFQLFSERIIEPLVQQMNVWLGKRQGVKWQPLSQRARKQAASQVWMGEVEQQALCTKQRKEAAYLIQLVLDEEITPTQALVRWPVGVGGKMLEAERIDASLQAAYQMLWHFEADEAQQQQEVFYLDTQMALLGQAAETLSEGNALPDYLLAEYTEEHRALFFQSITYWDVLGGYFQVPLQIIRSIRQVVSPK